MRIVISLGGSVLANGTCNLAGYADIIKKIAHDNTLFIVTGGGQTARDYIKVARTLGASESACDMIGIDATRLNARLLICALGDAAYPEPPRNYTDAAAAGLSGKVVVMGGVIPGQTTDAVSAVLAEHVGADLLINATSVDGVYTKDPNKYTDAKMIPTMTPRQLVEIVRQTEMVAGANSPFDLLAAKIIERSGIKTLVISGKNPVNILNAVKGTHTGTTISES